MAPKCRRVAVLGAGVGGLASIKTCLEEGMEVVGYESRSCVGGVWSGMKDQWSTSCPAMYRSLVSNTSKSMTSFSDFPCPASYPPFLPHGLYQEYLTLYAEHFRLVKHIKFNTRVLSVSRAADHASSGRWRLMLKAEHPGAETTLGGAGGEGGDPDVWEEEFDGVIVAAGFYSKAKIPNLPGLNSVFTGSVSHACSYVEAMPYRDKTVLVVGNANSAGDIACDLSNFARQVYLSVGDGMGLSLRMNSASGLPNDLGLCRMMAAWFSPSLVLRIISWIANRRCNHRALGLLYTGRGTGPIVINDEMQKCIVSGKIKVIGHVSKFGNTEVTTEDGLIITGVDAVIFATGYDRDLSMLDDSLGLGGDKLELYKQVFPVHEEHHTLALVGCVRVAGPMPPSIELQARMAAYTLSGTHTLPSADVMKADCDRFNAMARRPDGTHKYSFLCIMMYEELAKEIGVTPRFWKIFFSGKPKLAFRTFFGSAFPFIYRLMGPGAWHGAEAAIERAVEENQVPLRNRELPSEEKPSLLSRFIKFLLMLSVLGIAGRYVFANIKIES